MSRPEYSVIVLPRSMFRVAKTPRPPAGTLDARTATSGVFASLSASGSAGV